VRHFSILYQILLLQILLAFKFFVLPFRGYGVAFFSKKDDQKFKIKSHSRDPRDSSQGALESSVHPTPQSISNVDMFKDLKEAKESLKRKEMEGNELLILQEKTKILKLTDIVLGGVQTIDSEHSYHQSHRLSNIRDILTSYPPVIQKDIV
jgi:hypothetical protein